jgi:hypothetical protein
LLHLPLFAGFKAFKYIIYLLSDSNRLLYDAIKQIKPPDEASRFPEYLLPLREKIFPAIPSWREAENIIS